MLDEVVGHVDRVHVVPPGVDIDEFVPLPRDEALRDLLAESRADPPNPGNANERLPDEGNAERLEAFLADDEPTVLYFGKLLRNKGVHVLFEALRDVDARAVVVGFGDYREELEANGAAAHALHRAAGAPAPREADPAHRRDGRAVDLPRGVRHGRGRGGRRGIAAARREPLGPRGDRGRASRPSIPEPHRDLTSFATGDSADLAGKLRRLLALDPDERARALREPRGARSSSAGAGRASRERLLEPFD